MSASTPAVTPAVETAASAYVLCPRGTSLPMGFPTFQTYSLDGAKKAATKIENGAADHNAKLSGILAKSAEARTEAEKAFLVEHGNEPRPSALDIKPLDGITLGDAVVRNTPKPVVEKTPEEKAKEIARLQARLAALGA